MTASSDFEAEIVRERLAEAGISVLVEGDGNPRSIAAGKRDIFVEEAEFERAQAALKAAQEVDEDELTRLSQESRPGGPLKPS
jgi:hypothetical protein